MNIDPKQLQVELVDTCSSSWTTKVNAEGTVHGREFQYRVVDGNFRNRNEWVALIQIPDRRYAGSGIVVRLEKDGCPNRVAVKKHAIWRKSIVFQPTSAGNHLERSYVKVFEAEKAGGKSIAKRGERAGLHPWLQESYFRTWMRLKGTVATSRAGDLEQQVLLSKPDDHKRMIRSFFALRVWPLI